MKWPLANVKCGVKVQNEYKIKSLGYHGPLDFKFSSALKSWGWKVQNKYKNEIVWLTLPFLFFFFFMVNWKFVVYECKSNTLTSAVFCFNELFFNLYDFNFFLYILYSLHLSDQVTSSKYDAKSLQLTLNNIKSIGVSKSLDWYNI